MSSQAITNIRDALLKAFVEKAEAEAAVKKADETITALRNVLAGVPVGQQVAAEMAAEQAAVLAATDAKQAQVIPPTP
jgi:hypothetical protein